MALTVLKVGGSLASEPKKLRLLMTKISELARSMPLVVVPGGGESADVIRKLDNQFSLRPKVSHRMAILAMDQYGLLLSDLSADSIAVNSFEDAKTSVSSGKLPIFLPSQIMFKEDPLENSWAVTSDSITLYIAHKLKAKKILFITDVDGIYTADPKKEKNAALIKEIAPEELSAIKNRTSVDAALPRLLKKWPIPCFVVNGFHPERVELLLSGKTAPATLINGKKP